MFAAFRTAFKSDIMINLVMQGMFQDSDTTKTVVGFPTTMPININFVAVRTHALKEEGYTFSSLFCMCEGNSR